MKRWAEATANWFVRPCLILGPAVVLGVLAAVPQEPHSMAPGLLGLGFVSLATLWLSRTRAPPIARLACWIAWGVQAGLVRGQVEARERVDRETRMRSLEGDASIEGVLLVADRVWTDRATGVGFDRLVVRVERPVTCTVRLKTPIGREVWGPGDRIRARGVLGGPGPPRNPGEADFRLAYRAAGIDGDLRRADVERLPGRTLDAGVVVERVRGALAASIDRACEPELAGLLRALTLGYRHGMEEEIRGDLQRCGASHVIAVSGLHVALLLPFMWGALSLGRTSYRARAMTVMAAVAGFTLLTGSQVPVVRCFVIVAVGLVAETAGRRFDPASGLSFAAALLALAEPAEVPLPSFQLTFAAVAGLMFLGDRVACAFGDPPGTRAWVDALRKSLAMSLAAWLTTAPIVLFHFHQVSGVAVLANLWVIPAFFVLTLLGYALMVTGLVWTGGAAALGILGGWLYDAVAVLLEWTAATPLAFTWAPPPGLAAWTAFIVCAGIGTALLGRSRRAAVALLLLSPLGLSLASTAPPAGLRIHVLDVRRGSAAVVECPDGTVVLHDAGSLDVRDPGSAWIAPAAWAAGIRRIDDLVLSHPDWDHIGGADTIIEAFGVRRVWVSEMFDRYAQGAAWLSAARRRHPGVRWEVVRGEPVPARAISPWCRILPVPAWSAMSEFLPEPNETSLIVEVSGNGRTALLTGDAMQVGMAWAVERLEGRRPDLVVAPHHGKRFDGYATIAARLSPPRVAVSAPAGYYVQEVIDAYAASGAAVDVTGFHGALTYALEPEGIRASRHLAKEGR